MQPETHRMDAKAGAPPRRRARRHPARVARRVAGTLGATAVLALTGGMALAGSAASSSGDAAAASDTSTTTVLDVTTQQATSTTTASTSSSTDDTTAAQAASTSGQTDTATHGS